jgi:calpain-15
MQLAFLFLFSSVLQIVKYKDVRLVQMRNPWGSFEWSGAWSDKSKLWRSHEHADKLRSICNFVDADDGTFWMSFEDFSKHFEDVDICVRTSGFKDLALNVHEEMGLLGSCYGCVGGCCSFWFMCRGCNALCCHAPTVDAATVDV